MRTEQVVQAIVAAGLPVAESHPETDTEDGDIVLVPDRLCVQVSSDGAGPYRVTPDERIEFFGRFTEDMAELAGCLRDELAGLHAGKSERARAEAARLEAARAALDEAMARAAAEAAANPCPAEERWADILDEAEQDPDAGQEPQEAGNAVAPSAAGSAA